MMNEAIRKFVDENWGGFAGPAACQKAAESLVEAIIAEARDRIMSLAPNDRIMQLAIRPAYRHGHASARYAARDVLSDILASIK
jgi:hypothetical protein